MNWEIFIAYHGSYDGSIGSVEKAREIYDFLHGQNAVNCYFYPQCGNGKFGNTPIEASHSRLFLLVANPTISNRLENETGEINEGEPIYEEIDAFYQNRMHTKKDSVGVLRVYCYAGYKDRDADLLFPVATKNVEHFDEDRDGGEEKTFTKILEWIKNSSANDTKTTIATGGKQSAEKLEVAGGVLKRKRISHRCIECFRYVLSQHSWFLFCIATFFLFGAAYIKYFMRFWGSTTVLMYWGVWLFLVLFYYGFTWIRRCRIIGFKKIYCSAIFGEANPNSIMKSSKRKIRFLGIASSKWLRDETMFKATLMRLCSDECGGMELLLLNPKSEYAKRMDLACKTGEMLTSVSIEQSLNRIKKIVNDVCSERGIREIKGFSIRLYSHYPIYRIIISDDDRLFLSFYSAGISGNNNYQIKIDGKKKHEMYSCMVNYYNQLWNDSSTVPYAF